MSLLTPSDNECFFWAMGVTAHTTNTIQLPADCWEQKTPERRVILIKQAYDLGARKVRRRGR